MSRTAQKVSQYATKSYQTALQQSSDNSAVGAGASSAVTISLPAGSIIGGLIWSYSGPVTTGGINIADSSGTLVQWDIHAGSGQNFSSFDFTPPINSQITTSALTVVLSGNNAVTGKLNVQAWTEF